MSVVVYVYTFGLTSLLKPILAKRSFSYMLVYEPAKVPLLSMSKIHE